MSTNPITDLFDSYNDDTDTSEPVDATEQQEIDYPVSGILPALQFSPEVKEEKGYKLKSSYLISFVEVMAITQQTHDQGAILIKVLDFEEEEKEIWVPKKLCSNLDLENNTICVWDVVMDKKIDDIGGLNYKPIYADEVYK